MPGPTLALRAVPKGTTRRTGGPGAEPQPGGSLEPLPLRMINDGIGTGVSLITFRRWEPYTVPGQSAWMLGGDTVPGRGEASPADGSSRSASGLERGWITSWLP